MADKPTTPTIPDSEPVVTEAEAPATPAVAEPAPEPKAVEETPPVVEVSAEDASAGYQAIQDAGVDMSSEDVQNAILEGASGDDLIAKFGTEPKAAPEPTEPEPKATEPEPAQGIRVGKSARMTVDTDEDAAILSIKRAKKVTLAEAARIYADQNPAPAAKAEPVAPVDAPPSSPFETALTEGADAITALEAEIKTATDDLEFDTAMTLTRKLTSLQIQQARTEDKRDAHAATSQASFDATFESSSQRAMAKFPALESEDSMERLAFDAFNEKEAAANPELFEDPNWPEVMAEKFSAKHGLSATSPAASEDGTNPKPAQQRPVTSQARRKRTDLLDGGKGGSEAPAPADEGAKPLTETSLDELLEQRSNMSPADREAFDADMHKARKS
jgi:hypothetical protein|tara:strand:+ start:22 stop:1185 length:1164 start_codon:yes stop_codon:yes gene_type:complete